MLMTTQTNVGTPPLCGDTYDAELRKDRNQVHPRLRGDNAGSAVNGLRAPSASQGLAVADDRSGNPLAREPTTSSYHGCT